MNPSSFRLQIATRSLLCVLVLCGASSPDVRAGDDEVSMQLLVETLGKVDEPRTLKSLMRGMLLGLEGRRDVNAPENWGAVALKLEAHEDSAVRDLASQLSRLFGDESAIQRALATVKNTEVATEVREKHCEHSLASRTLRRPVYWRGCLTIPICR